MNMCAICFDKLELRHRATPQTVPTTGAVIIWHKCSFDLGKSVVRLSSATAWYRYSRLRVCSMQADVAKTQTKW